MMSLGWGLYGAGSIVVGMRRGDPPLRYIGMSVLVVDSLAGVEEVLDALSAA